MKLLLALLLSSPLAAAQQVSCPLLLPEGAVVVAQPPAGWKVGPPSLVRLSGAGVKWGLASGHGYLVPDAKKVKGGTVLQFQFEPGEEKWLWCEYGTLPAQIAKRMDDAATLCTMTIKKNRHGWITDITTVCRA